jgi:hypothetical protein
MLKEARVAYCIREDESSQIQLALESAATDVQKSIMDALQYSA